MVRAGIVNEKSWLSRNLKCSMIPCLLYPACMFKSNVVARFLVELTLSLVLELQNGAVYVCVCKCMSILWPHHTIA